MQKNKRIENSTKDLRQNKVCRTGVVILFFFNTKTALIGAWKLVSYTEKPVDGSAAFYPMSEKPMGIIMYIPNGFMSAQLMHPDRKNFASGDWFNGIDEEYKQQASTYIAYTGPFHVEKKSRRLLTPCSYHYFPTGPGKRNRGL